MIEETAQAVTAWYAVNKRDLPWRHTADPYRIWISEIMLQQTQAATVVPYYERFIETLPDVYALAATYYYAITGKVLPDAVERMQEDTMFVPSALGVKISSKQEDALLKALEINAGDRYQNMADFHREMAAASTAGKNEKKQISSAGENQPHTEQDALDELARLE